MFYDTALIAHKLRRWETYLKNYHLPQWNELPQFDLYMDQVIALLYQYLDFLPKDESPEKLITSTAINNYVRLKIMPAPVKKKYSRIHLAYLIMIISLKQSISISHIQKIIPMGLAEDAVQLIYDNYVQKHREVALHFIEHVRVTAKEVLHPSGQDPHAVENLVTSSAIIAGFFTLMTEKILFLQDTDAETALSLETQIGE